MKPEELAPKLERMFIEAMKKATNSKDGEVIMTKNSDYSGIYLEFAKEIIKLFEEEKKKKVKELIDSVHIEGTDICNLGLADALNKRILFNINAIFGDNGK